MRRRDGTADGEGEHLFVRFAAEVSSCGGRNAGTAVLRYRPVGSETWTTSAALAAGADNLLAGFSIGRRYELSLELSDAFSTSSFAGELSTAERIVHFRADGKGLALGKMSEKPGLEVAWAADFAKAPTVAGTALLDLIYPVGSIYMSMQNASPAETLGGDLGGDHGGVPPPWRTERADGREPNASACLRRAVLPVLRRARGRKRGDRRERICCGWHDFVAGGRLGRECGRRLPKQRPFVRHGHDERLPPKCDGRYELCRTHAAVPDGLCLAAHGVTTKEDTWRIQGHPLWII